MFDNRMLTRFKRPFKLLVTLGFLLCAHNIYKATFGQFTRQYSSSHEYFESLAVKKQIRDKQAWTYPKDNLHFPRGDVGVSSTPSIESQKAWMRDLSPELSGNLTQLIGPYIRELLNGSSSACTTTATSMGKCLPAWQRHLAEITAKRESGAPYYLTEVLQVRLYEDDKSRWTLAELKQWFHYMFLAGVEHIFICDHYFNKSEMLKQHIKQYVHLGLVTYIPWGEIRHPMTAQIRCYQHVIDNFKDRCKWQLAVDMDEYPVSPEDMKEGFMVRYLRNMTSRLGNSLTEITMANYLMLGQGDRERDIVIDRINRMTPRPANILVKPVYRPQRVRANVHHNFLIVGKPVSADPNELRMLHYWGARAQNWGPDTAKTLAITVEMNEMRTGWAPQVRNSLLAFGEVHSFSNSTGP